MILANLTDPHRKHQPPRDTFITRRLDARHLHGSEATDKLGLLPGRARRTRESPNETVLKLRRGRLGPAAPGLWAASPSAAVALEGVFKKASKSKDFSELKKHSKKYR